LPCPSPHQMSTSMPGVYIDVYVRVCVRVHVHVPVQIQQYTVLYKRSEKVKPAGSIPKTSRLILTSGRVPFSQLRDG
jgi:hypothetical protein